MNDKNNKPPPSEAGSAERKAARPVCEAHERAHPCVLVVDDFSINHDVVEEMLLKFNILVDSVHSGPEAIERITYEENRYDAIFMDRMMPKMDGIETTRRIRALETEYARNIPIIAVTTNDADGDESFYLKNGFNDFLAKPLNINKLEAVIRQWIQAV